MGISSYLNNIVKQNNLFLKASIGSGRLSSGLTDQTITTNNLERYQTDYFCGSQVAIFLGDLWIADMTMIQYEMTQAKRPFYGYKSQKWDLVAKGTQIIHGAFAMNYTRSNFLNMAIAQALRNSQTITKDGSGAGIDQETFAQFLSDVYNKKIDLETLEAVEPFAVDTTAPSNSFGSS
jgi:hypothetical protein